MADHTLVVQRYGADTGVTVPRVTYCTQPVDRVEVGPAAGWRRLVMRDGTTHSVTLRQIEALATTTPEALAAINTVKD